MRRIFIFGLLLLAGHFAVGAEPDTLGSAREPFKLWRDVKSPELKVYAPPYATRYEFPNGMVVLLLEDHELPLIDVSMTLRFGEVNELPGQTGVAAATAEVMRSGGSEKYPADQLDEKLENMAASFNLGIGIDSGSASLAVLKGDFDSALDLFVDVLQHPAFPEDKLDLYLTQARTGIARRNDRPAGIASREFRKALYGEKSPYAKVLEHANLNQIDRPALQAFHRTFFQPSQFILGVVGDFQPEEMLAKLRASFGAWPAVEVKRQDVPSISTSKKKKTFFVERPRIDQTTFIMGHMIEMRRDSKDYPAMLMLNQILSGSMSARMFTEVRTKKGLAYGVSGSASVFYNRPGAFVCSASTRNEQALDALQAVQLEVVKIRDSGVTEKELEEARESELNSFVFEFDSPAKILNEQLTHELYGYPVDFSHRLAEAIQHVQVAAVNEVARRYLDPDKFVLVGCGGTAGLDESKTFRALKDVQLLDVTIPMPATEPMVIDPRRESEGRKILSAALQAAGGIEEFKKIKTLRGWMVLDARGFHGLKGCFYSQTFDTVRVDIDGPFGAISQIVNEDSAWKASGSSVEVVKPQEARRNLRLLLRSDLGLMRVLAAGTEGYNVQALEPVGGLVGVEIESKSLGRLKMWFDAQTNLLAKIKYVPEGVQKEYEKLFSNHTTWGPLTLASTIEDKDPDGPERIELLNLQLNPPVDTALLQKPLKATLPMKQ